MESERLLTANAVNPITKLDNVSGGKLGTGCGCNTSSHPQLAILIAFITFTVDTMIITVIDPIIPQILQEIDSNPQQIVVQSFLEKPNGLRSNNETYTLQSENSIKIAALVGLKPLLETLCNVFAGFLIQRVGHRNPMLIGCGLNIVSTLSFGYLRKFYLLLAARALQAIAGSLSVVGAMVLLAETFKQPDERLRATSIAFIGISIGITGGYLMGSSLYQFCSPQCPFLITAGIQVVDGLLRVSFIPREESSEKTPSGGVTTILKDPLIIAGLTMNFMQKFCIGFILATVPAWQLFTLGSQQWNVGAIFGCSAAVMMTSQFIAGRSVRIDTIWLPIFFGLLLLSIGVGTYPLCSSTWEVLGPDSIFRVGVGILEALLNPMLCHLVDTRHQSQYGIINGFYTASYNFGLGMGPLIGGSMVKVTSFQWSYLGLGIFMLLFSFTALTLRNAAKKSASFRQSNAS